MKLKNFLNEIKLFFRSLNELTTLKKKNLKFIFFSENQSYQKYLKPIIEVISSKYPDDVYYFSIDKKDKINHSKIKSYFIYNSFLTKFFFNNIKCENMILTLTDLGNHYLKKTKNIKNYIYYFHSPVSTTKNYTPKAFDNYDVIMCNGNFQIKEIEFREKLKRINKKKLIPTGYFYFDYLIENIKPNISNNEILIAPSWNYSQKHFINENFIELIDILLRKKQKVTFRPHPEHFKRSKFILDKIKQKATNENFNFDMNYTNITSMEKAKCLITDSSGIAIEFIVALKRPVLYLDEFDKVHNSEFSDYYNIKTIDHQIRDNFGYLFKKDDFKQIDLILEKSINDFEKKIPDLNLFITENFVNFGRTKDYLNNNLEKIFKMN